MVMYVIMREGTCYVDTSFKGYFTVIYVVITIGQAPSFGVPYKDSFDGVTLTRCDNPSDDE